MDLQVTIDREGAISGFYMVPVKGETDAEWVPASYSDSTQFSEKPVEVGTQHLGGMLTLPKGLAHFPMVVMLSGSGPNDMDESLPPLKVFRDLAQGLATRGVGSLRFEKRTHRRLPVVTVKEEYLDDAAAAIAQAAAVPGATKVVLLGHSLGAMMVPRVALGNAQVAAAVMLAGSTWSFDKASVAQLEYQKSLGVGGPTIDDLIKDAKAEAKKIVDPDLKPSTKMSYGITGAYYLDLRSYDAVAATGKLTIPVFLAWGDRDLKVIPADWAGWRTALGERPNLTYRIYPGLQHMFSPVGTPDVAHVSPALIADLVTWIAK
jgi:dienelactone hydrolase